MRESRHVILRRFSFVIIESVQVLIPYLIFMRQESVLRDSGIHEQL